MIVVKKQFNLDDGRLAYHGYLSFKLIVHNKIDTSEQLQAFTDSTQSRMDDLIRRRTHIQNKLRRMTEPEAAEALKAEKSALTRQITPLRGDLKLAAGIAENTVRMKERIAMTRQIEWQEKQKLRVKSRDRGRER